MLFNSFSFLLFFPAVIILFFLMPKKLRACWLLLASYFFYGCWNVQYLLLLFLATVSSYGAALLMGDDLENRKKRRFFLVSAIVVNLGLLGYFKYFNFLLETAHKVISKLGGKGSFQAWDILLPMGISFFVFQAIGYVIDVYRGKVKAEKNFLTYALFISFFPQLVAGPIERAEEFLPQIRSIKEIKAFDTDRIMRGTTLMLYGYFMKMVIADRAAIFVDVVFDPLTYEQYHGVIAWVGAILFSIQIYCDFAGYTLIAIGCAKVMGFDLMDNFHTPYLARSIKDFWARWHISLTGWFRDYLYFPLGGSRKGALRKYVNVAIVFLVSGLWHGAAWHFVLWGGIHGALRIIEELTEKPRKAIRSFLHEEEDSLAHQLFQIVFTFLLVTIAWVAFRASSIHQALSIIKGMLTKVRPWALFDGSLYQMGLDEKEFMVLFVSIAILILVDVLTYRKKDLVGTFLKQPLWFRWIVLWLWIGAIVVFGIYGENYDSSAFIYFQF
ncbi:MAG: MBOAT family protein [Lachnospiraceae bacterium]|nr:MBOAT family protein [Lachnospiraceae bacterium]